MSKEKRKLFVLKEDGSYEETKPTVRDFGTALKNAAIGVGLFASGIATGVFGGRYLRSNGVTEGETESESE